MSGAMDELPSDALTVEQAARAAKCDRRTVDRAIQSGRLAVRRVRRGRQFVKLISRQALEEWAAARQEGASSLSEEELAGLLSVREAARRAGYRDDDVLLDALRQGRLVGVRILVRGQLQWRIDPADLTAWLAGRRETGLFRPDPGSYLSVGEVCRLSGLSMSPVLRAIGSGQLPGLRGIRGKWWILRNDFESWIAARASDHPPPPPETLTLQQAAELIGRTSRNRLKSEVSRGKLPAQLCRAETQVEYRLLPEELYRYGEKRHPGALLLLPRSAWPPGLEADARSGKLLGTGCQGAMLLNRESYERWLDCGSALGILEASLRARASHRTLKKAIQAGELATVGDTPVKITPAELERWMATRTRPCEEVPPGVETLNLTEASLFSGASGGFLRREITAGRLQAYRTLKEVRVVRESLQLWVAAQKDSYTGETLSVEEAARRSGLPIPVITRARKLGRIERIRSRQGHYPYLLVRESFERWLKEYRVQLCQEEWLSVKQCARLVGVSPARLLRHIREGTLPARSSPRGLRIHTRDLNGWLIACHKDLDPSPRDRENYLSTGQAVQEFGLAYQTILWAIRRGYLPVLRVARPKGKAYLIPREALAKWAQERQAVAPGELGPDRLTVAQAAEHSGRSRSFILLLVKHRKLPAKRVRRGRSNPLWAIPRQAFERWLAACPPPESLSLAQMARLSGLPADVLRLELEQGPLAEATWQGCLTPWQAFNSWLRESSQGQGSDPLLTLKPAARLARLSRSRLWQLVRSREIVGARVPGRRGHLIVVQTLSLERWIERRRALLGDPPPAGALHLREAAREVGLSRSALRVAASTGELRVYRDSQRLYSVTRGELLRWVALHRAGLPPESMESLTLAQGCAGSGLSQEEVFEATCGGELLAAQSTGSGRLEIRFARLEFERWLVNRPRLKQLDDPVDAALLAAVLRRRQRLGCEPEHAELTAILSTAYSIQASEVSARLQQLRRCARLPGSG